jgi:hypothetical protein
MTQAKIFISQITRKDLEDLPQHFDGMVKGVIDIQTEQIALGAPMHADEESMLLQTGSSQDDLWGFNIYLNDPFPDNIEFDSMINIRPYQNNHSRSVEDKEIQTKILTILKKKLQ